MNQRVSTKQAAHELGVAVCTLRNNMQTGAWADLGDYIPREVSGKSIDTFYIYREKLDKHLGREADG